MIKLLHTADLHLDAPFPSLGEQEARRREDFFQTFERLLNLAIKREVDLFVVAGDLFDSPRPSVAAVSRVQAGLQRLAERGIVPVLLPGTHDSVASADSVYRRNNFPAAVLLDGATVEEPVVLAVRDHAVHLYGFAYRGFASEGALETMTRHCAEGIHIGLLHGSRQGSPEWDYRKKDLPFTLDDLRGWGLDYVALGHYHGYEELAEEGCVLACYPGSPEGKRFGENGPRHCALVTVGPQQAEVERLTVNGRVLEERSLDIGGCADLEEVVAAVSALGDGELLLRLTLTGIVEAPLDLEALAARCAGSFFHLQLQDRSRLFDSAFALRIEQEETVRGVFVRRARKLMGESPEKSRPLVEEAFREVLVRFRAFGGDER